MGLTSSESMISRTFATLIPNRLSLMVNSMISISFVPLSNKIPFFFSLSIPYPNFLL